MSVGSSHGPVPTGASTLLLASSASAHRGATCWATAGTAPDWSACPAMRVTHTAPNPPSPPSPLLGAVPTSSCSTIWPLRVSTPTRAPQGGATGGRSRREAPVHSCPLVSSYFDFVQTSTSVRRRTSVSTSVSTRRGATGVSAPLDIASWQTGRRVKVGTTCCPRQPCSRTCMLIKKDACVRIKT